MIEDPIVEEIRLYRAEHAAQHQHNLNKICKALQERQKRSTRQIVANLPRIMLKKR